MIPEPQIDDRFAKRQHTLLSLLACPLSRRGLDLRSPTMAAGAIVDGELWSEVNGRVGVIRRFQPSFLERDLVAGRSGDPVTVAVPVDLGLLAVRAVGWDPVDKGILTEGTHHERVSIESAARGLNVSFFGHSWSGQARITSDHGFDQTINLYRDPPSTVEITVPLPSVPSRVTIEATGRKSPEAVASQVVVQAVHEIVDPALVPSPSLAAVNRGNPYPERFHQLVEQLPADGVALDCGGGDRRYGDDRVFNLEYLGFPLPDLYGDGLQLPLLSNSFDLILSQAVLEHVPDPQRAVDELLRVLKPGGVVYIEVAFMQPLHAVPSHYMNVTPYGLRHLCRSLDVTAEGVFGGLFETISWIGRLIDAPGKIGAGRYQEVLAALTELDSRTSNAELTQYASGVYLEGRKPVAAS